MTGMNSDAKRSTEWCQEINKSTYEWKNLFFSCFISEKTYSSLHHWHIEQCPAYTSENLYTCTVQCMCVFDKVELLSFCNSNPELKIKIYDEQVLKLLENRWFKKVWPHFSKYVWDWLLYCQCEQCRQFDSRFHEL